MKVAIIVSEEGENWIVSGFYTREKRRLLFNGIVTEEDVAEEKDYYFGEGSYDEYGPFNEAPPEDEMLKPGRYISISEFKSWSEIDDNYELTNFDRALAVFGNVENKTTAWNLVNRKLRYPNSKDFVNLNVFFGKQLKKYGFIVSNQYLNVKFRIKLKFKEK